MPEFFHVCFSVPFLDLSIWEGEIWRPVWQMMQATSIVFGLAGISAILDFLEWVRDHG